MTENHQLYSINNQNYIYNHLDDNRFLSPIALVCQPLAIQGQTKTFYILNTETLSGEPPYHYKWQITDPDGFVIQFPDQRSITYNYKKSGMYSLSVHISDSSFPEHSADSNCLINVLSVSSLAFGLLLVTAVVMFPFVVYYYGKYVAYTES